MGNNGSSGRDQQQSSCARSGGLPVSETATHRGWSQSFPRELARHRSQPAAARKVLPEPPNQRLRTTDNGCIILNGGTISGRRAATLPSPSPSPPSRDLEKHRDVPFRGRSVTMSNVAESRTRRADRYRHRCQTDSNRSETSSSDLKRCGSEPDLRYSSDAGLETQDHRTFVHGKTNNDREDERSPSYRRFDRETKDRIENRYKARKKYKAPAPPTLLDLAVEPTSSLDPRRRFERDLEPPPRRSRLFKTRAETKKAQVSWQLSGGLNRSSDRESRDRMDVAEQERACERGFERDCERRSSRRGRDDVVDDADEASIARDWPEHDRIRRRNEHRQRSRLFDGKNTLQRSMSSPEFQAELIQAARRVRDKLDCGKGAADESVVDFRSLDSAKLVRERSLEGNPLVGSRAEERRERVSSRARNRHAGRMDEAETRGKIETVEKPNLDRDQARRPLRERLVEDVRTRARIERKHGNGHRRAGELEKYGNADVGCNALPRFANDDAIETRGWPAGRSDGRSADRSTTPEKLERRTREKENSDPSCWNDDFKTDRSKRPVVEQWSDTLASRKFEGKFRGSSSGETTTLEDNQPFVAATQSTPKTFYFGMNEILTSGLCNGADQREEDFERPRPRRKGESGGTSANAVDETDDNGRNVIEDISLKLRPTLPKKQLEIPRFSPSAAWRLLSSLEAPGPSMSTTSEEMPVMFEERIERLSRPPPPPPPPPLLAIGPRSLHDKSGDSGISGDAGAANDDSLDVSTTNRMKRSNLATRQTWTPQQDLGEELSSDAGVDSPPPLPASLKYPPRPHVFSLSLPRDDGKTYLYNPDAKLRESSAFNSLKKLKRSVSGAFGIGAHDIQRKRVHDILDDNWLLSTSAPNSLQHNQISSCAWKSFVARDHENGVVDVHSVDDDRDNDRKVHDVAVDDCDDDDDDDQDDDDDDDDDIAEDERLEEDTDGDNEGKEGFPVIMKSPSFSYLAPGGHVMYLPESNEAEYRVQSLNGRKISSASHEDAIVRGRGANETFSRSNNDAISSKRRFEDSRLCTDAKAWRGGIDDEFSSFRGGAGVYGGGNRSNAKERGEDPLAVNAEPSSDSKHSKSRGDRKTTKRFTFQSTVRQIERRRLAEKLSKEAEAKERQRRGEMEAMRRVEEEFQRKRAKEKANIRQQLRLFKEMEENFNRLPTVEWDGSQLSRADPDGAPSSATSSPTSLPAGKNVACSEYRRKGDANSRLGSAAVLHSKQRPKYYDWSPETSSHLEYKQTTVHPKIVCDIPKSSPAFADVNAHPAKPATSTSTPRSDNYRKDFAHGTVGEVTKSSFASSDSELSQPTTRPHSRQIESKGKPQPSRSASPASSEDAATSEEDLVPVDPAKRSENPARNLIFSSVQPFAKEKTYRPISFNPQSPPFVPS